MTAKPNVLVVKATALRGNIGSLEPVAYNALLGTCKYTTLLLQLFIYLRLHRNSQDSNN